MTDTNEMVEEVVEEESKTEEVFDPREWAQKTSGAYRFDTMVDNSHLPQVNRPKVIPVKETFECNTEYINNVDVSFGVRATKDIESGGIVEECSYWGLESRLNDFIKGTKDKIGVRLLWTLPIDDATYKPEEYGPHLILLRGNGMSYERSESPNAYYEFDTVTRTVRFFALRPIQKGEMVSIGIPSSDTDTPAVGASGITPEEFGKIAGVPMAVPAAAGAAKPGGCSSCGKKATERKAFRDRSKETQ